MWVRWCQNNMDSTYVIRRGARPPRKCPSSLSLSRTLLLEMAR